MGVLSCPQDKPPPFSSCPRPQEAVQQLAARCAIPSHPLPPIQRPVTGAAPGGQRLIPVALLLSHCLPCTSPHPPNAEQGQSSAWAHLNLSQLHPSSILVASLLPTPEDKDEFTPRVRFPTPAG